MANSKEGTPRWRRLPAGRRAAIIAAALAEFDVKGLSAARMDDIAQRAGLSKGSIYRYFADKDALFAETIAESIDSAITIGGGGAPNDRQLFLRRLWATMDNPDFQAAYKLSLTHEAGLAHIRTATNERIDRELVQPLARLLDQTERESHHPDDASVVRARLAISTLLATVALGANTPRSVDAAVAFLLRACELQGESPQADGF